MTSADDRLALERLTRGRGGSEGEILSVRRKLQLTLFAVRLIYHRDASDWDSRRRRPRESRQCQSR
jgi:hypothetical protein